MTCTVIYTESGDNALQSTSTDAQPADSERATVEHQGMHSIVAYQFMVCSYKWSIMMLSCHIEYWSAST